MTLICSCFQGKEAEEWGTISRQSSKSSYNMNCLWNVIIAVSANKSKLVYFVLLCFCNCKAFPSNEKCLQEKNANHSKTGKLNAFSIYPSFILYIMMLWCLNLLSGSSHLPSIHHNYNNYNDRLLLGLLR